MTRLEANRSILKELTEPVKFRHECNQKILAELADLVEKHPDWRFHQILMNFDIEFPGEDRFYEESNETLAKLKVDVREKSAIYS